MFWGNFVRRRKKIKDEQPVKLGRGAAWGIQRVTPKTCRGSIPLVLQRSQSEGLKLCGPRQNRHVPLRGAGSAMRARCEAEYLHNDETYTLASSL